MAQNFSSSGPRCLGPVTAQSIMVVGVRDSVRLLTSWLQEAKEKEEMSFPAYTLS